MEADARTLRVAAVQIVSRNGSIEANLEHCLPFVEEAAEKGARIIILPEFMPTGYLYTTEMWNCGEPCEGPTMRWLREHSRRLGVYLGTSFLEAEGDEFFNTFVLSSPDGTQAGRVRKQTPAAFEAYFTRGQAGTHVINTELAKIGVGICYENQLAYIPMLMYSHAVDLMLMPHSAPTPAPSPIFPPKQVELYNRRMKGLAAYYAKHLGIPAIMINKCGPWESPLPGLPFLPQKSYFPGYTAIADSNAEVKSQLANEEGVLVEDVLLDPSRKAKQAPPVHGRWSGFVPWPIYLFIGVEAMGKICYTVSTERRRRAREIFLHSR